MQGHIHKRTSRSKDGKERVLWYVIVEIGRTPDDRRRQKWHGSYKTRREAEAARAKIVNDMNAGAYVEPNGVTFSAFIRNDWLPSMKSQVKYSTWDSYRRNLELHVLPRLGSKPLQQITASGLNALYAELLTAGRQDGRGGLSAKTVRYIHATIHKALADACDAQLVAQNAASRAKPPRPRSARLREMAFWSPDQLRAFLNHIHDHRLYAAFHLAAMTGMRRGEVLGLRWKDVDLDSRRASIRHTTISVAYELIESTPKTHQARVVDLDPDTVDLLRQHLKRQAAERDKWGNDYQGNDLVFARENGSPIHPDSFTQTFDREVAKSGLPWIRLHDLRHTHATIALRAGVSVKVISERLGHESPAFTLKQYAHVIPGMQAEAAAQIAACVAGN